MFDPTYPPTNAEIESAPLRSQFNGLKALIDAVPAGPPGPPGNDGAPGPPGQNGSDGAQGPPGQPFTSFVVDNTTTLNPSDPATVQTSFDGSNVRFQFGIPRGNDGTNGSNGSDGAQGPQGPPFANAVVDSVTTLNPGDAATVQTSFDGSNVRFQFGIPRGSDGTNGSNGTDGMQGPPGPAITSYVVDNVSTLNPGDYATVNASFDGTSVRFSFGIPRGNDGSSGSNGSDGAPGAPFTNFVVDSVSSVPPGSLPYVSANFDGTAVRLNFGIPQGIEGPQGYTGPQGPPFASAVVDSVTTLNPGDPATVQTSFDGSNVHFQFGIPRGNTGNDGGSGPPGPPGEVTFMQLNSAINGTSNNSNAVNTLAMTVSDPPTVGEVQAIASKLDELILALRR